MSEKRTSMSKKLRFEIFKRDHFTCQYCGRPAPEVVLQVDHISPVAQGGGNEIENLITSCVDCNQGKSDRALTDAEVMKKRKAQLDQLQERREQLTMMLDWQKGLAKLEDQEIDAACELWEQLVPGSSLNDLGRADLRREIKRFGVAEILECMRISAAQYLHPGGQYPTQESKDKTFEYIGRIASSRKSTKDKPYLPDLYRLRKVIRQLLGEADDWRHMSALEGAYLAGYTLDEIKDLALQCKSWAQVRYAMVELTRRNRGTYDAQNS